MLLGCIHCECGKSTARFGGTDKGDLHQWAWGGGRWHSLDHPCLGGSVGQRHGPSSADPGTDPRCINCIHCPHASVISLECVQLQYRWQVVNMESFHAA